MIRGKIKKYFSDREYGWIEALDIPEQEFSFQLRDCEGWVPYRHADCEFVIHTNPNSGKQFARNVRPLEGQRKYPRPAQPIEQAAPPTPRQSVSNSDGNPYHFADIDLTLAVTDAPIWHNGEDAQDRHTGKLRISLRALTPILVGATQYKLKEACPGIKPDGVNGDKNILQPFRLTDDVRRVALSGKSLNGMIRHSLGALLSAPMERVAERVYSYRPALAPTSRPTDRLRLLPAVIDGWKNSGELRVKILRDIQYVYFSRGDAIESRCEALKQANNLGININLENADAYSAKGFKQYFEEVSNATLGNGQIFSYVGGIDSCGELHKQFRDNPDAHLHKFVAISTNDLNDAEKKLIGQPCIDHYLASLEQLADDKTGHLMKGHPLLHGDGSDAMIHKIQKALKQQADLWRDRSPALKNQLIYVEVDQNFEIRSFGHNFHYRWRHVDSVRLHHGQPRAILRPLDSESTSGDKDNTPPAQLSGARLFCGYVSRREDSNPGQESGSDNIGTGRHQRLKGRIGCGFAVEHLKDGKLSDQQRFLPGTENSRFLVPLKTLGMPRPSAVEHYLRQPDAATIKAKRHGDGAGLLTYGDLPGDAADTPGELAGRKFYRHQPDAANPEKHEDCFIDKAKIADTQSTLARFISQPGTEFRFTLDFQDLRDWELGALLVTVFPAVYFSPLVEKLAADETQGAAIHDLQVKLARLAEKASEKDQPTLAHKLGYGRPLGLGSVALCLDRVDLLTEDSGRPALSETKGGDFDASLYIEAFAGKLLRFSNPIDLSRHLERWAAVHRYAGLTRAAYRTARTTENHQTVWRIYAHHTDIRKGHMKGRRQQTNQPGRDKRALPEPNLNGLLET
ncbi:TIGR03986 family type III CRISPR-associated RAMP protein [Methylomagnum sp.]